MQANNNCSSGAKSQVLMISRQLNSENIILILELLLQDELLGGVIQYIDWGGILFPYR